MVILGLGSNVGDRLQHLRQALRHLKQIPQLTVEQVSPVYLSDALLPDGAPTSWDLPYLNLAIRCETTLTPHALLQLTKTIEETVMGRVRDQHWGPRPIDIDILAWDDQVIFDEVLQIPHAQLLARPFALWPLADVAPRWVYPSASGSHGETAAVLAAQWGSRFSGAAPFHTRQLLQRVDAPELMGIINLAPDSFSDGGTVVTVDAAIQHAHQLVTGGATLLDIGAEATGPLAKPLDAAMEWTRLEPVLTALLAEKNSFLIPPKISVDTRHAATAERALLLGVDCINDVSGLSDSAMRAAVKDAPCDIVIMHQLGIPQNNAVHLPLSSDPCLAVYEWAETQLEQLTTAGFDPQRIIIDVGIGFGKTAEQSLLLLRDIAHFKKLPARLLVGHSRKSFLRLFTDKSASERDMETLAVSLYLSQLDIDYLRLHQPEITARALKVQAALAQGVY
jgi:2-amino-4-hydroxy-6-hydroxymethyldihydropteridine diphosphokinase/dihydropteroate synthase